jgi:hypothetical protein
MSPTPHTAQAERNAVKSKPAPLRLRRFRGYAQGERESNQGYTQVKIALEHDVSNVVVVIRKPRARSESINKFSQS